MFARDTNKLCRFRLFIRVIVVLSMFVEVYVYNPSFDTHSRCNVFPFRPFGYADQLWHGDYGGTALWICRWELAQPTWDIVGKIPKWSVEKSMGRPYKLHRVIQPSKTLADKLALGTSVFFECVSPWMRPRCSFGLHASRYFPRRYFSFIPRSNLFTRLSFWYHILSQVGEFTHCSLHIPVCITVNCIYGKLYTRRLIFVIKYDAWKRGQFN